MIMFKSHRSRGMMRAVMAAALGIGILAGPKPAAAAAAPGADERVQLQVFLVKVQSRRTKRLANAPLSVILHVKNTKHANYVCSLAPRLRDTLLQDFSRRRFSREPNGHVRLLGLAEELQPKITQALRWDIVTKVEVVEGVPKVSSASAAVFARTGCIEMVDPNRIRTSQRKKKK